MLLTQLDEMAQSNQENETEGAVVEALPNTLFRVQLAESGEEVLAYLAGRMRKFRIKVLVGDTVRLQIDPYGGKARIVRRL